MAVQLVNKPYYVDDRNENEVKFLSKYRIKEITVESPREDYYNYSYTNYSYKSPYDNTVIVKMSVGDFKDLTRQDNQADRDYERAKYEEYMRRKHEAIYDAWDKYQMLLALMKD